MFIHSYTLIKNLGGFPPKVYVFGKDIKVSKLSNKLFKHKTMNSHIKMKKYSNLSKYEFVNVRLILPVSLNGHYNLVHKQGSNIFRDIKGYLTLDFSILNYSIIQ